jgi:hypothetical protein
MAKKKKQKAKQKKKKPINAVRIHEAQRSTNPYLVSHIISIAGCVLYVTGLFLPFFYAGLRIPFAPHGPILEAERPFAVSALKLFLLPGFIYILSMGLVVFLNILGIVYKKDVPVVAFVILIGCGLEPIYYLNRLATDAAVFGLDFFKVVGAGAFVSVFALIFCLFANTYQTFYKRFYDR